MSRRSIFSNVQNFQKKSILKLSTYHIGGGISEGKSLLNLMYYTKSWAIPNKIEMIKSKHILVLKKSGNLFLALK